jgi:hypothetical protein
MKKPILLTTMVMCVLASYGQWQWELNFDNSYYLERVYNDTISNPDCTWQVGQPQKSVFTSAYSIPNAIVTDILSPAPPNDTSAFFLIHERDNLAPFHVFILRFWYNMDGDTTDYGTVEISPNSGLDWINVLIEDTTYQMYWESPKPTLEGSSNGWQYFDLDFTVWASDWGFFPIQMTADTILFRFTYITDGETTPHDGWIIDDFNLEDWWEGLDETQDQNLITIYPNPASDRLEIRRAQSSDVQIIQIYNSIGQLLYNDQNFSRDFVDISQFKNGVYFMRYSATKSFAIKKFMINHCYYFD